MCNTLAASSRVLQDGAVNKTACAGSLLFFHELECGKTVNEAVQKYEVSHYIICFLWLEVGELYPLQPYISFKEEDENYIVM